MLLNKADLLPQKLRAAWASYFQEQGADFIFWSAKAASEETGGHRPTPAAWHLFAQVPGCLERRPPSIPSISNHDFSSIMQTVGARIIVMLEILSSLCRRQPCAAPAGCRYLHRGCGCRQAGGAAAPASTGSSEFRQLCTCSAGEPETSMLVPQIV